MDQYRVIGHPLKHSLSPQIHTRLFALSGKSAHYEAADFPPERFGEYEKLLRELCGYNVTSPYKQQIIPLLDELDECAAFYGAVNTVRRDGARSTGYNTDCDGFLHTMSAHGITLGGRIGVLGAGGVGRMFAIESALHGAAVTLIVRQHALEKGQAVAREIKEKTGKDAFVTTAAECEQHFDLLINATPVGMYPDCASSPVPEAFVQQADIVFDCIYNPAQTLLLQFAHTAGKRTIGGMDMLVWQAAAAHTIWYGAQFNPADVAVIIEDMNQLLRQNQ